MSRGKSTSQKAYPDLGSDASSVWNFFVCFTDVILRGNRWWSRVAKCPLFSQASTALARLLVGIQSSMTGVVIIKFQPCSP